MIITCKECGHQVSDQAASCPNCGAKVPKKKKTSLITMIVGGLFTIIVTSFVLSSINSTPSTPPKPVSAEDATKKAAAEADRNEAFARASTGASQLKRRMRNPDSFVLEQAVAMKPGNSVCYLFRSQNGFGGMDRSKAVLTPDGKTLLLPDSANFEAVWKRECVKKAGEDLTRIVNPVN
jgi:hypothetical protein